MYQSHRGSPIKWFIGFVISVHIMAGLWAADRAWKQVRSMSLIAGPDLAAGSRTRIEVVTSGRAAVTVVLTLAQGARTDTIAVQRITTRQPDDGMHDIAIAALTAAIEAEGGVVPGGSERPTSRTLQPLAAR